MRKILLLNGPNLDMLGMREPEVYGRETLESLQEKVALHAYKHDALVTCIQSNSESALIDEIHRAEGTYDGIVYNPGAHTHYSYALRDAIGSIDVPVVEVHISDIDAREPFRRVSVIAPACVAQVKGLGFDGYCRALDLLCERTGLERLGEGYEERFPEGLNIIVAGEKAAPAAESVAQPEGALRPNPQPQPVAMPVPVRPMQSVPQPQPALQPQPAPLPMAAVQPQVLQPAAQPRFLGASAAQPQPQQSQPASQPQPQQLQPVLQPALQPQPQQPVPQPALQPQPQQPASQPRQPQPQQANSPQGEKVAQESTPQDFTAPFAQGIAATDAGLVSFERQTLVRMACERLGIGAILVRDTSNIRWITAFDGVFDEERAHALLVTRNASMLHTDSRYSNAVRTVAQRVSSNIGVSDERTPHAKFAKGELEAAGFAGRIGIEDTITYAEFVNMAETFGTGNLAATTDVVVGLRAVKNASELNRLRAAQAVTDAAFEHIVRFMRPGMTEREIQLELDNYMLSHGGEGLAFSTIVATGANGADPHAIPGCTRLEAGQCVVMDFGAKAFGYCSDMTRTVFLGQPDAKMASAWEVLRRANETVESMLRPGVTGKAAHETAERVLADGGFAGKMGHGLGHGVGIDVHELPVLNPRNDMPLVVGNVVTVEPGIYLPGEFGMRLEDCGVIAQDGYHPFSRLGHDMVVL